MIISIGTALTPSINYNSPGELRTFLVQKGLGMRKKFGQNFLINPSARSRLLDGLDMKSGDEVWEVGPGLGAMTAGLLERGGRVTAFEIDPAFSGILRDMFAPAFSGNCLRLIEGDVLKTWPAHRTDPGNTPLFMGNLPYNIAAVLMGDFIEKGMYFRRMVLTVQREVALRMAALPGSEHYSSFSVLCSSAYKVTPLLIIKRSSFFPVPRVDSQGVRLDLLSPPEKRSVLFYPLVRALFSSRRKTIRNTLSAFAASVIIKPEADVREKPRFKAAELAAEALARGNISDSRRAETLEVHEFAALAVFLEELILNG